jgi:hypothetical protein
VDRVIVDARQHVGEPWTTCLKRLDVITRSRELAPLPFPLEKARVPSGLTPVRSDLADVDPKAEVRSASLACALTPPAPVL